MRRYSLALAALLPFGWAAAAQADFTGVAVYGDSLSDEYQYQSYSYARNWVEQLAVHRGVNVGPIGTWGEPRRQGYEYNWARYGATSLDLIVALSNDPAWDDAIASGAVSHAVLAIGSNDFFPGGFGSPYLGIYYGSLSQAQIQAYVDNFLLRIELLVDVIRSTGAGLVLATPPDYGVTPYTWNLYQDGARRESVATVMADVAARMDQLAQEKQIVIVDVFQLARDVFGPHTAPHPFLDVGGVPIRLLQSGTAGDNGFVADGIHAHTVLQGLLGNAIMDGLNHYGAGLTHFSEQELVARAGLTYVGDTLAIDFSQYVRSYAVPEASSWILTLAAAAFGLSALRLRSRAA